MSFNANNLSVLAYASNFTLWHYATEDSQKEVKSEGYFNKASDMLRENDLIILNMNVGKGSINDAVFVLESNPKKVVLS